MKKRQVKLVGGTKLSIKKMEEIIKDFKKLGEARCNGNDFFLLPSSGINGLKWAKVIKKRANSLKVEAIIEIMPRDSQKTRKERKIRKLRDLVRVLFGYIKNRL